MKEDELKQKLEKQAASINTLIDNQTLIVKKVDELEAKVLVKETPKKEEPKKEEPKKEEPKKE